MDRIPTNLFPYSDYHTINLDWVISRIQEMYAIIDDKISAAVNPIRNDLDALTIRVNNIDSSINTINETLTIHTNRIEQLFTRTQNISQTIGSILGDISTINGDITTIKGDITNLDTRVNTHTLEIADIYNKIADIDPDTGLIVDATNFDTEEKTITIMDDVLKFELTGGNKGDVYYLQPDLIPNTQAGYYPRVTMDFDPVTDKVALPSELTTGDFPLILRGTFATNVNVDAETFVGPGLEYSIDGKKFNIEGSDETAIILMCLFSMHHSSDNIENIYNDNDVFTLHGIPCYKYPASGDYEFGLLYQHSTHLSDLGINEYIYCFDKAGNLISYGLMGDESTDFINIPVNTYSIWVGIHVPSYTEKDINTLSFFYSGYGAGAYVCTGSGYITMHVVDFLTPSTLTRYQATYNDIMGLGTTDKIDMISGKVYRGSYNVYDCDVNGSLNNLNPNLTYTPTLTFKDTGYLGANLKYNKVSLLINGLDANNTRY